MYTPDRLGRFLASIGAACGWATIILQFYLMLQNKTTSLAETIIRFFSFFTILTNLLVAVCFTSMTLSKNHRNSFFSKTTTLTATTVYILVVGVVYNVVLRPLWQPQGLQKLVDEMLHTVIPIFYLLYWFFFIRSASLQWKQVFHWLLYPLCYLAFILLRGSFSDFYPYPFVNVLELGYAKVLLNAAILLLAFVGISFLFVGVSKTRKQKG